MEKTSKGLAWDKAKGFNKDYAKNFDSIFKKECPLCGHMVPKKEVICDTCGANLEGVSSEDKQ
jgi:rRNA maturation endonuclease Nob1